MACHCPTLESSVSAFRLIGSQILSSFKNREIYIAVWRCPLGDSCKNQGSRLVYKLGSGRCWQAVASQRGCNNGIPLHVFPESSSIAFTCLPNLKSTYQAGANRPLSQRLKVCQSVVCAVLSGWQSASNCLSNCYSPVDPGTQAPWLPEPGGQCTFLGSPPQKLGHQMCVKTPLWENWCCGVWQREKANMAPSEEQEKPLWPLALARQRESTKMAPAN